MNRTALVVGAAGGVGSAVTTQMLEQGYRVIATVLNDDEARQVQTHASGVEKLLILDLADADSVLTALQDNLSTLDAAVVCAAVAPYGALETTTLEGLRRTLEINTVAALAVYQATLPLLRAAQGRIVFLSSFAGKAALPLGGHYAASKHALEGLADVMRREAGGFGVEVILIEPGGIKTLLVDNQIQSLARARAALSAEHAALYGKRYDDYGRLIGRALDGMLTPDAVASVVLEALQALHPQARYEVGDDAKFLCAVARQGDAELDAAISGFWNG